MEIADLYASAILPSYHSSRYSASSPITMARLRNHIVTLNSATPNVTYSYYECFNDIDGLPDLIP